MSNPFDHFGTFLYSVWDHAFTLAAGCVFTVVITLIEKHFMNGKKLPLKADIAILLMFVLFACFQAWHDEFQKADHLQASVNAKPVEQARVDVKLPSINIPPPTVIVEPQGAPARSGYLKLVGVEPIGKLQQIAEGVVLAMNVSYANGSDQALTNVNQLAELAVGDQSAEDILRKHFHADLAKKLRDKERIDEGTHLPFKPFGVDPEVQGLFVTARSPPLTATEAEGVREGTKHVYLNVFINWTDENKKKGKIDQCYWIHQSEGYAAITPNRFAPRSLFKDYGMTTAYQEGPEALKKFEDGMKKLF